MVIRWLAYPSNVALAWLTRHEAVAVAHVVLPRGAVGVLRMRMRALACGIGRAASLRWLRVLP
jgi:hypothetical protein